MSKSEGLNNGVLEAGAIGLPIISTRSGAAEEIIKDGENGFLVNRDVNMLSDFLLELRDAHLRKEVGEKMRDTIHSNWTWGKRIEDFRKMFSI
jgi:glycosyltransferase involved in cell wall biosynthesis